MRILRGGSYLTAPAVKDSQLAVRNYVRPRVNQETGKKERHVPLASYEGPGTDVERRLKERVLPTTKVDRAAMNHDVSYFNIRSGLRDATLSVPEAKKKVREADNRLISEAKRNLITTNPANMGHAVAALAGIKTKEIAEDVGIIDKLQFVGKGKKKKDPLKQLRKEMIAKNLNL